MIEEIAKDVSAARKPYVCGMHYSNPVPVMRMLEIIYTPDTSQEVIEAAKVVGEVTYGKGLVQSLQRLATELIAQGQDEVTITTLRERLLEEGVGREPP